MVSSLIVFVGLDLLQVGKVDWPSTTALSAMLPVTQPEKYDITTAYSFLKLQQISVYQWKFSFIKWHLTTLLL